MEPVDYVGLCHYRRYFLFDKGRAKNYIEEIDPVTLLISNCAAADLSAISQADVHGERDGERAIW